MKSSALRAVLPCFLLLHAPAAAQEIGVPEPAARALPAEGSAEQRAWKAALEELAASASDPEALTRARSHLARVAWRHPHAPEVLEALFRASGTDADARALWAHAWWGAACDAKGKGKAPKELAASALGEDAFPERLAATRAEALRALVAWAQARKPAKGLRGAAAYLESLWAREVGRALVEEAPALAETASALDRALARFEPPWSEVIEALEAELTRALAAKDLANGIKAARLLRGLCAQGVFQDLKGPTPPDLSKVSQRVASALERLRAELRAKQGEPLSVDALDAMEREERERFSDEHRDFAWPGIAVSPEGLYRLETSCGHATLLGAADTVERHHRRLVDWYGKDPFVGRPGLVRIVPESFGLEEEGAPFWWAGGFQGGDVTTVKFTCGTIEGLGRTLTHELTHRFDGAIYPGLPAWMMEGRAVWTGGAYGSSFDTSFTPGHASFGGIEAAFIKGYGDAGKLEELVTGKLRDYRDNYSAGYALWVYLSTWEPGAKRLFEPKLLTFMTEVRKGLGNPKGWFEACFCDGVDGRPKDFASFAQGFATFLRGFYWQSHAPWTERYQVKMSKPPSEGYVYEDEAWSWERERAEPWFGQDQASFAAALLLARGNADAAAAAYAWARTVDEWSSEEAQSLAALCEAKKLGEAAWMTRELDRARSPWIARSGPRTLPTALAPLAAHVAALEEAAAAYRARSLAGASYALARRAALLARWWGAELPDPAPPAANAAHALDLPARRLGLHGWVEDDLTGYEERRVKELWYETPDADLFVGRKAPREGTGGFDRASHQRDAFVRSREWIAAGRYTLRLKVHFTTSFNSGAIVLGYGRRDRNLRLHFSAGDFLYAIGQKEELAALESVHVSLHGLRVRDGHLGGALSSRNVDFGRPTSSFEVVLWVDGARAHAWVHGQYIGTYHTVDGQPIEGHIGFAMGQGAVRIEAPTVERLDLSGGAYEELVAPRGFELDRAGAKTSMVELANRAVRGVPLHARGTLAIFVQAPAAGEALDRRQIVVSAQRAADRLKTAIAPYALPQRKIVLFPAALDEAGRAELAAKLGAESGFELVPHAWTADLRLTPQDDGIGDDRPPFLLFVDPAGVLRAMTPFSGVVKVLPDTVKHWCFVFRQRPSAS
ncbi:MAG: hypothetical protein JNM84_14540 [Planctomycetes bacterium]|nr:hypothetical protein [Planctomycetota bacterium]